jgi:hypothetical protein
MSLRTSLGFFSAAVLATALNGCVATTDGSDGPDGAETTDATQDALTPTYEVGPGKPYANLQAVASKLKAGDVVNVYGGTPYSGDIRLTKSGTSTKPIKIMGIAVNGVRPVLSGGTTTIEFAGDHYLFQGFDVTGGSSRCVFHHADDITIHGAVIHDCPTHGLLGADEDSGSLTLENSEVYRCGSGDTHHQIYMATDETAHPGAVFRMRYDYVHDGNGGNNVKSRAERNEIYYNWIEGAYYYEVELIGPDGQDESLAREDSDVVGNVLFQGYTTRSHYAVRIGGDGTGQTWGRYRFLNNTIVMGNASTSAAFRAFDGIESVELHNNALSRQGGGAVSVLNDGDATWANGRVVAGSNNWVTSGSTSVPSTWTNTRQGSDPGFNAVGSRDLGLLAASPLRELGNSSPASPSGHAFPRPESAARFEPPRHARQPVAVPRTVVGVIDDGAFE